MKAQKNIKAFLFNIFLLFNFTIGYAQNIIYVSDLGVNGSGLYELDLSDCSLNLVTTIQATVFDITFHPNGELYGIDSGGSLYRININTGAISLIHTFVNDAEVFNSMTADINGIIYVAGRMGNFYSYNIQTGEEIFYGIIPNSPSGDFTFYQGNLYVAAEEGGDFIIQVDIENPENSTTIINQNVEGDIFGIVSDAFDCSDVQSYGMFSNELGTDIYQIDFETSSLNFVCEVSIELGGGASTLEYLSSTSISIDNVITDFPTTCLGGDGSIEVVASGGVGQLEYSINGIDFQPNNQFTNLSIGTYTLTIRDENNCVTIREVELNFPPLIIENIIIAGDECEEEQRDFSIQLLDFSGPLDVSVNDTLFQSNLSFQNYQAGTYDINIMDEFGCEIDTTVILNQKFCSIYIPNAFSPNGDGFNDVFKIYPHPLFEGEILTFNIFDRWGNILYENNNYDVEQDGWDGSARGKLLNPSVFVYMVKVDFGDGIKKTLSGDVTLID